MFEYLSTERGFLVLCVAVLASFVLMHAGRNAYRVWWPLNRAGELLDMVCGVAWKVATFIALVSLVLNVARVVQHV